MRGGGKEENEGMSSPQTTREVFWTRINSRGHQSSSPVGRRWRPSHRPACHGILEVRSTGYSTLRKAVRIVSSQYKRVQQVSTGRRAS